MSRRAVRITVSVAISALFLAFAVRGVHWGEAGAALRGANYVWVLLMLPITVWTLLIRAQRWRVFLLAVGSAPLPPRVSATNIGFMANMVLPLRIGEVVRPVLLARRANLPLSGVLASVLLERIFDMFTILLLFGLSASLVGVSDQVQQWGWMLSGLAFAVAALIAVIRVQEPLALSVARRLSGLVGERIGAPLFSFVQGFVHALRMLDSPRAYLRAFGWSVYLWVAISIIYVFGFWAFHLDVPAVRGALVMTTLVAIAVSVPSAPGFIGSFQLGCVVGLKIFGVGESSAIAFSLIVHLTQFVGVIGAGLYSLWRENMSLRDVEAMK
ncbi:MAG: lysylphosphatidylglycerol synthase transmembrane domain-containing protein [Candidatus Binatia bacterium]